MTVGFAIHTLCRGSFTYYVTQCRWVGGLQNVTIPMQIEKFYYAKVLLEVSGLQNVTIPM